MIKINLRDYYPFCNNDIFLDVPTEVAAIFIEAERQEEAYRRRTYRYNAQYSLDLYDSIEHKIFHKPMSPYEIYERQIIVKQLKDAFATLSEKQSKRIYAYCVLGISKSKIAQIEGVSEKNIRKSINLGLQKMKIFLKNHNE